MSDIVVEHSFKRSFMSFYVVIFGFILCFIDNVVRSAVQMFFMHIFCVIFSERHNVTFAICYRNSVCRLSSVCRL